MHTGIPISYTIIFKGETYDPGCRLRPDYWRKIYIKDICIGDGPFLRKRRHLRHGSSRYGRSHRQLRRCTTL